MKWDTRLTWVVVGLLIALALTSVIYGGHIVGIWDWLWTRSGLWQFFVVDTEIVPAMAANEQLVNPGFEEGFFQYQGIGELKVPNGYEPWWHEGDKAPSGTAYRRPEWAPIDATLAAYLVHGGTYSSKMFTTYGAHQAGLRQRVKTIPGEWYTFSAWVYVWSSSGVDGHKSEPPQGRYRARVCANPWGSSNAWDDTTICGKDILDVYDSWQQVSVTFQAWSGEAGVFIEGNPWHPVRSNDSTWDDLALRLVSVAQPCPTPTPCPACPECPVCPTCPEGSVDYDRIQSLIRQALDATHLTGQ